jgi:ABC-2 type transport system permease protein/sodium transport system permease protein
MSTTPSGLAVGRFARLARKELTEILRDRRTVLTLLLMPLLLYPLLSIAFRQFLISGAVNAEAPKYRVGFLSEEEAKSVFRFLAMGEESLARRGAFRGDGPTPRKDAITRPQLEPYVTPDLEEAVRRGQVEVGARLDPTGAIEVSARTPLAVDIRLLYHDDSVPGLEALHYVERLCREANANFLSLKLQSAGIDQRAEPLRPVPLPLPESGGGKSQLFAVLVPLILILMTITGAVYPAIDLTAGERERGTLEVLVAAPVPRWALLGAKYVAVVTVAVLTALVNLGSMTLTLWASGLGRAFFDDRSLSVWLLPEVFGLLLLLAAFFSGVLLALTSFARSFKEAQAYLIPLMLASLMPGMIGMVPGLRLEGPLAVVPLINIVLLARDLLDGRASPLAAAVVVLATSLYAVAAIAVAARTFGAEAVLYAQQGGWRELFERPQRPRATATASGAMLCLALMFPVSFVLNGIIVAVQGEPITSILSVQAAVTIALFGALPFAAAWFGRVRAATGFRLAMPSIGACLAAILLGLCLWPLAYELGLLLRTVGVATLSKEQLDRVEGMLAEYRRGAPPVFVLLVLAVLPAVFEELFFRGYLFSALLGASRPRTAILTSALLFGVFHVITAGGLAFERLAPSTLLGVVLGWVCWKSGSVVPGTLLHAVHNSLLVSLGLYQPWFKEWGWSLGEDQHLPVELLLGAVAGSVIGSVWVWALPRPQASAAVAEDD